jgi:Putative metal-binding motif/RTX calcium-binding nonapeptide repeat (4 copies)
VAAVVTVGAWAALAGAAQAATITGGSTPSGPPPGLPLPLNVAAAPTEANHIEVVASGSGFIVRETGTAELTNAAPSCSPTGTVREYLCALTAPGTAAVTPVIHVALGDRDDTFRGDDQPLPIIVDAGGDDDTLFSGGGVQAGLNGGAGVDTVDYSGHAQPVNVSLDDVLNDGGAEDGGPEGVHNIERITGGSGSDLLTGSAAPNRIDGGPGGDVVNGGDGADSLLGDAGNDQLTGGAGADTYAAGEGDDSVTASDGVGEDVDCGEGNDGATVDVADRLLACETVSRVGGDADRDGDGAVPPQDCDDGNPAIRPGARDVPRNGIDEDCSGADAKRRTVRSTVAHKWAVTSTFAKARKFTVMRVPARGVARLTCAAPKGKRGACPFKAKRRTFKRATKRVRLLRAFKRRRLPVGTVIELRVTRAGWIGRVYRFKVRSRKIPRVKRLCLAPGKKKPRSC